MQMTGSPLFALEVAHDLIRERLQEAANDALAARVGRRATGRTLRSGNPLRLRLAEALRGLAARLDPSPGCEPCLGILTTSR
jgi:hypothetical protein